MTKKTEPKSPLELLSELKCLFIDMKIPNTVLKIEELEAALMKQKEVTDDIRLAVAEHLGKHGWRVVLVANHGVKKPDRGEFKYEYFCDFLGSQIKVEMPDETQV